MSKRSLLLIVSWILYVLCLSATVICVAAGFYANPDVALDAVLAGMSLAVYPALALTVPVVMRWWLKNAFWGTFGTYAILFGASLYLQATYQELIGNLSWVAPLHTAAWFVLLAAIMLMYKHFEHMIALMHERSVRK